MKDKKKMVTFISKFGYSPFNQISMLNLDIFVLNIDIMYS